MKNKKKICRKCVQYALVAQTFLSVCCACLCAFTSVLAQPLSTDTLAEVRCTNIVVMPPSGIEFDIVLRNRSREGAPVHALWERWANGTFILSLQNLRLKNNRLNEVGCELDSTSLPIIVRPVNGVQTGYEVKVFLPPVALPTLNQTSEQRIALAFIGADSVLDCSTVQRGTERLLGRFRVEFADTLLEPERLRLAWALPLEHFQANAFKVSQNLAFQGIQLQAHDNAEMFTTFSVDTPSVEFPPELTASGFSAEYIGDKRVKLTWNTSSERVGRRTNAGFVLLRKNTLAQNTLGQDTARFDTVARFQSLPALRLRGNASGGVYEFRDSVSSRGDVLLYRLVALDATPSRTGATTRPPIFRATLARDTASVRIPNAVFKETSAQPNPFSAQSRINYTLEDRARVSATLYDATGRIITRLIENIEQARGTYSLTLDGTRFPEQFASQGLLMLVLTALPTDDAAVEKSEAVLKLQFVR